MGLVDYSESSDSESDAPVKPTPQAPSKNTKKPAFQKVVDRSNPGKIRVTLQSDTSASQPEDEPPAKRPKIGGGGGGGGLFSAFNSLLPPPKNAGKPAAAIRKSGAPQPGFRLRTGAEPAFSRTTTDSVSDDGGVGPLPGGDGDDATRPRAVTPPPAKEPGISDTLKPAEEVKLVGKPLMFKPLSVARKPTRKNASKAGAAPAATKASPIPPPRDQQTPTAVPSTAAADPAAPPPEKKKVSLFNISSSNDALPERQAQPISSAYEPLFSSAEPINQQPYDAYPLQAVPPPPPDPTDLATIADDLNLTPAARRELFGRQRGAPPGSVPLSTTTVAARIDMGREYAHNEQLRAAGDAQPAHNPVRAIAPGKHSLRQLVGAVQNQRDALEESFAKGRTNQKEAAGRYGW